MQMVTSRNIPWRYGDYRLGRCKPCNKRYVWPNSKATLDWMACPVCKSRLSRTTLVGNDLFIVLDRPPYGPING